MRPVNPLTPTSSTYISRDSLNQEDQDIWFDAIDYVEIGETWFEGAEAFDTHEEHQTDPSSSAGEAADSRVPFTEDCRRGVQQLVRTLGEYGESRMLSACFSKILPGTPTSLIIAANSLYTAVTERRNIDTAALHALGLASGYLPDNINIVSRLATFIRDTVTGWTDETFLQQFLGNEDNHTSTHLFTALAVTAIVAGRWMKDEGAPQRGVLKVPAFMANILIRASHYWTALGNMAGSLPSGAEIPENTGPSQRAPAFEVDTQMEMTGDVCDATASGTSAPRLTAFSSNSTANPEAYTRGTVENRPAPAPGKDTHLLVPEQAHYLAVEKLRQESGLSGLLYCTNLKTETHQQTNEKVITNSYFNTKCDVTVYPEPLTKGADSIPVHTDIPETQVSSAATSRGGDNTLLPLVMTGAVVAPVATSYMQALKSKPVIAAGVTAALTGAGIGGKWLWDKFSTHNPEGSAYDIENNALKAKKENIKIINTLVNEGVLKKGKFNKERLLSAVAEYLFGNEMGIAGSTKKVRKLAKKILSEDGLYGGENSEVILAGQYELVIRQWVFKLTLEMTPTEYIEGLMKADKYPGYYTVNSIQNLLSIGELLKNGLLTYSKIPLSQRGYLNSMWYTFLKEDMPFLDFTDEKITSLQLGSYDFSNLYAGSRFLNGVSDNKFSAEDAMEIGKKIWDLAMRNGVAVDAPEYYKAPVLFFFANTISETNSEKEYSSNIYASIGSYLQNRKYYDDMICDITNKYNNYLYNKSSWLGKSKLADRIIAQCRTEGYDHKAPGGAQRIFAVKESYINGFSTPCKGAPENLSAEYKKITEAVADSYREFDNYLIIGAIAALPKEEQVFIHSPDAKVHQVDFNMVSDRGGGRIPWNVNKNIKLENAELFAVSHEKEERIYAVTQDNSKKGRKILRVDRDVVKYSSYGLLDRKNMPLRHVYGSEHVVILGSKEKITYTISIGEQISMGDNLTPLINFLSDIHRNRLYESLFSYGNDLSLLQKEFQFFKSMLPFYDCVEGVINNDVGQAIPSCTLDAINFLPVAGEALSLSAKFGISITKSLRRSSVYIIEQGIKAGAKNILREIYVPTNFELASLGGNIVRAIDPGFDMLRSTSRDLVYKVEKLLFHDKKTSKLASAVSSSINLRKFPHAELDNPATMAFLPGTNIQVPVSAIGEHEGRDIYVMVNPKTNYKGGLKYHLGEDGHLEEITPETKPKKRIDTEPERTNKFAKKTDDGDSAYDAKSDCYRVRRGVALGKLCPERGGADQADSIDINATNELTNECSRIIREWGEDELSFENDLRRLEFFSSHRIENSPAINDFAMAGEKGINEYLRYGEKPETYLQKASELKDALLALPDYNYFSYRVMTVPHERVSALNVGGVIYDKGFSCSSGVFRNAKEWLESPYIKTNAMPNNDFIMIVYNKNVPKKFAGTTKLIDNIIVMPGQKTKIISINSIDIERKSITILGVTDYVGDELPADIYSGLKPDVDE